MPPYEEFPTKGEEAAPSNDIGWHFGTPVSSTKGNFVCKQLEKVSNHNMSDIKGKNSDEVLVVGVTFIENGDLLID
ncbi:hypothetical protein Godav_023337 [Gossypium davidsonii]|uniref:Uncharacterized protein n=1 Tax=Gossypium davidsonii TaxID=34287 RepID=A0A7J8SRV3_GOSDV|nr:hypothetical protein [Gossypium davidsonii]